MPITGVSYRRVNGSIEPIDIVKGGTVMAARKTQLNSRKETEMIATTSWEPAPEDVKKGTIATDPGSYKQIFDNISNPVHYTGGRKYEPRKVIMDWDLNFYLGNVVKYISRAGRKGDALNDLMKAKQYLEWEIERLEEKEEN